MEDKQRNSLQTVLFLFKLKTLIADFENMYDMYCGMLYSIALQLCPTKEEAEKILVKTFEKIFEETDSNNEKQLHFVSLIKLIIKIAQETLYPGIKKCNFKIKQFSDAPLLHQLLVEQQTVEDYCDENNVIRSYIILRIRNEFSLVMQSYRKNVLHAEIGSYKFN